MTTNAPTIEPVPDFEGHVFAREAARVLSNPTQLRVALILLSHANRWGTCWPGVATIARLLGHEGGVTHVRNALRGLERHGLIDRVKRGRGLGFRLVGGRTDPREGSPELDHPEDTEGSPVLDHAGSPELDHTGSPGLDYPDSPELDYQKLEVEVPLNSPEEEDRSGVVVVLDQSQETRTRGGTKSKGQAGPGAGAGPPDRPEAEETDPDLDDANLDPDQREDGFTYVLRHRQQGRRRPGGPRGWARGDGLQPRAGSRLRRHVGEPVKVRTRESHGFEVLQSFDPSDPPDQRRSRWLAKLEQRVHGFAGGRGPRTLRGARGRSRAGRPTGPGSPRPNHRLCSDEGRGQAAAPDVVRPRGAAVAPPGRAGGRVPPSCPSHRSNRSRSSPPSS